MNEPVRVCRYTSRLCDGIGCVDAGGVIRRVPAATVTEALIRARESRLGPAEPVADARLVAPIDEHEVWGSGVTYRRSRDARMAESEGARDAYAAVYEAERAELFFKATAQRVAGPGEEVVMRRDARQTIPEPELALWLGSDLALLGIGLGNDMTARDIEAENPLYLPQAKVWDRSCALGPWVVACTDFDAVAGIELALEIQRSGSAIFHGAIGLEALHRAPGELVAQLGRELSFPGGAVLLTGTGIVPPEAINLEAGDEIRITGTGLGELHNRVTVGAPAIREGMAQRCA